MDKYKINCLAMSIVNFTNETNYVPPKTRQKNNDRCYDFASEKIKENLKELESRIRELETKLNSVLEQWQNLYEKESEIKRIIYESKLLIEELQFPNDGEMKYSDDFVVDFIKYKLDPYLKTMMGKTMTTPKERKGKIPNYKVKEVE